MVDQDLHHQGDSLYRPSTFICLDIPVYVDTVQDDISSPALSSVTDTNEIVDNAFILLRSIPFIAAQMCFPVVLGSGHCESTTGFERNHSGDAAIRNAADNRG